MKLKLRVKWNQIRKKLQESVARLGGKYFIFRGSHENYLRNGAWVLEDSIALFHGRANPYRHFSVGELNKMNVETVEIHKFFNHGLYKGSWEGRDVFVGHAGYLYCDSYRDYFTPEIVVAAQMATHTNVHKLLGCCLETVTPVLVYEWVAPQTLKDCILLKDDIQHQRVVVEWKDRLRIAWEISHIIAYLHTAFPRPILYLNLNPDYIFLSPERDIKFSDFSLCASIPKNQEFAELVVAGTSGFIAPEYMKSGEARESTDVYSFGVLLLMLLTGKHPSPFSPQRDIEVYGQYTIKAREMCIYKKIDPTITRNGVTDIEELQLRYSIQIALLCVDLEESCRPTMVEVATELMNIIKSPQKFVTSSISKMFQLDHYNNHTGDDEFYDCDDDSSDNNDERCDDKYLIFEGSHENYLRNRAQVLEESIALFHGRANPFRHFSVGELNTMNVETVPIHKFFCHNLYKGSWEGRDVLVGIGDMGREFDSDELFLPEIVVGTQMATHTNVHKLLGCCLETVRPVLVYEWVAPQTLEDCILLKEDIQHQRVVVEWKDRLRIAWEISHIIAYLHTAFPRPILYRNLNPNYVFLSPERATKLSDFSLCASIPKNQEFVELLIAGRFGFVAPEYFASGEARESADVYSFGVLLLMLLTGKNPSTYNRQPDMELYPQDMKGMCAKAREMCIYKKIDPTITRNGVTDIEELQLRYSIQIALLCIDLEESCRPTMVEVATMLMNIIKSPQNFVTSSISKMFQLDHYNNHTSDDESYDCDDDNSDNNDEEYYDCEQNNDQCNDDAQG